MEIGLRFRRAESRTEIPSFDNRRRLYPGSVGMVGIRRRGEHIADTLNKLVVQHGRPTSLVADNNAAFTGRLMDLWADHHGTRIHFSMSGKPTDNALIETFSDSLRDECLNAHWFESIENARTSIEQ